MPSSCPAAEPDLAGGENAWNQVLGDCCRPAEDVPVRDISGTETMTQPSNAEEEEEEEEEEEGRGGLVLYQVFFPFWGCG